MQTSAHLRFGFRLRAVSRGAKPPADSVPHPAQGAPDQEGRPALPNPPRPTSAVGSPFLTLCVGTGGAFTLPCPPEPSLARPGPRAAAPGRLAVGDRPGLWPGPGPERAFDLCPPAGAGLARPEAVRGPRTGQPDAGGARQVCYAQTAGHGPHPALPRGGRQDGGRGLQDRVLAARATAGAHASRRSTPGQSRVLVRTAAAGDGRVRRRGARRQWLSGQGRRFLLPLSLVAPVPLPQPLPSAGG